MINTAQIVSLAQAKTPEQKSLTINNTGGPVDIFNDAGTDMVTLQIIANTSSSANVIYLGFGVDAVVGINPVGQGIQWSEAWDGYFVPYSGRISAIAASDGATISIQRRVQAIPGVQ